MQQMKLFKSVEADIKEMEREINRWMEELQGSGGRVVQITGNIAPQTVAGSKGAGSSRFSPSDLFVVVLYESQ